jgi:hypothetical protein
MLPRMTPEAAKPDEIRNQKRCCLERVGHSSPSHHTIQFKRSMCQHKGFNSFDQTKHQFIWSRFIGKSRELKSILQFSDCLVLMNHRDLDINPHGSPHDQFNPQNSTSDKIKRTKSTNHGEFRRHAETMKEFFVFVNAFYSIFLNSYKALSCLLVMREFLGVSMDI